MSVSLPYSHVYAKDTRIRALSEVEGLGVGRGRRTRRRPVDAAGGRVLLRKGHSP